MKSSLYSRRMGSSSNRGSHVILWAVGAGLGLWAPATLATGPGCPQGRAALQAMLASEYAFADRAQTSVRGAFLDYLAEDALVLNPEPRSGRPIYQAAPDSKDKLEWYPSTGDVAPSGDLGFTAGPWVYTSAAGTQSHGHFVSVWQRDSNCHWHVEFDGGVSHAAPRNPEPKLHQDLAPNVAVQLPPAKFLAADAPARTIEDFQVTAQTDGLASALRTYARDQNFQFFADQQFPAGAGAATVEVSAHPVSGHWQEAARGRSVDSTVVYCVGEIMNGEGHATHAYLEIWQYDAKVANWGLRVLLVNPLPVPVPGAPSK